VENQPAQGLCRFIFLGVDGVLCVVHGAHLFVLSNDKQAGLEPAAAVVKYGANFSQCNVV
jgi:hypothetical protein